jgi:hypothetical protein
LAGTDDLAAARVTLIDAAALTRRCSVFHGAVLGELRREQPAKQSPAPVVSRALTL